MKVGILTLSSSDNCGSLLQTLALQMLLERNGHDVEVINFTSEISKKMYRSVHLSYIKYPKKFIGQFLRHRMVTNQIQEYQNFRNKRLYLSNNQCSSIVNLKLIDGLYDYVVCGSDQVWNAYMHDFDPAFLLSWCNKSKRVAYAASLGKLKTGSIQEMIKEGLDLSKFKAVSVRESSAAKRFKEELDYNVDLCLDPTLLITKDDWLKLIEKREQPKGPYIFYYSYNYGNDEKNRIVKDFSKETGLPVFVINASRWVDGKEKQYGFRIFENSGPLAFLNLMEGCAYSLVESFHGCIFSYLFEKNFFLLEDREELDDRLFDLLDTLDLKSRVLRNGEIKEKAYLDIKYPYQSDRFIELKKTSEQFLLSCLR